MALFKHLKKFEEEDLAKSYEQKERDIFRSLQTVQIDEKGVGSQIMRKMQNEISEKRIEQEMLEEESRKGPQAEAKEKARQKFEADLEENRARIRAEKNRQMIRNETPELRELVRRLESCYVGKINHARILEKQREAQELKLYKKEQAEAEQQILKEEKERDRLDIENREREKYALRLVQQQQLIANQKRTEQAYQAFLHEKLMTDFISREICEEIRQKKLGDMLKQKSAKKTVDDFLSARILWKERFGKQVDEENRRIEAYWNEKNRQIGKHKRGEEERREQREERFRLVSSGLFAEKKEKMEKDEILQNLAEAQKEEIYQRRKREEHQESLRRVSDMRMAMCQQSAERLKALEREEQEAAEIRKMMKEEEEKNLRLEGRTAELQRIKKAQHRASVERQLRERRVMKQVEVEKLLRGIEDERRERRNYDKMVEEERVKILEKHAPQLLGYIPHDLLSTKDEARLGKGYCDAIQKVRDARDCYAKA